MDLERKTSAARRLLGRRIALSQHRGLDRLARTFESEGATSRRCPFISFVDGSDQNRVQRWVRALAAGRFDSVIFLSGEGITRIGAAARAMGLAVEVLAGLTRARLIVCGPQTALLLRRWGLRPDVVSPDHSEQGVIQALRQRPLRRCQVGIQLAGNSSSVELVQFLETRGADLFLVTPYRVVDASGDDELADLIQALARREIDVLVFSSPLEVERLLRVAHRFGLAERLCRSLAQLTVVAAAPAVREALERLPVGRLIAPPRQFFARRLVEQLASLLE